MKTYFLNVYKSKSGTLFFGDTKFPAKQIAKMHSGEGWVGVAEIVEVEDVAQQSTATV